MLRIFLRDKKRNERKGKTTKQQGEGKKLRKTVNKML